VTMATGSYEGVNEIASKVELCPGTQTGKKGNDQKKTHAPKLCTGSDVDHSVVSAAAPSNAASSSGNAETVRSTRPL